MPFVRIIRPDGCEQIFWGVPSAPFAVAAMFDPDAARPTLIEMPDLADAMKGSARGRDFRSAAEAGRSRERDEHKLGDQSVLTGGGAVRRLGHPVHLLVQPAGDHDLRDDRRFRSILCLLNIFLGWMAWVKICLPILPEPSK